MLSLLEVLYERLGGFWSFESVDLKVWKLHFLIVKALIPASWSSFGLTGGTVCDVCSRTAAVVGRGSCWEVWFACGGVEGEEEEGKIVEKFEKST